MKLYTFWRAVEPGPNVGIFTTYDSCKGLERPVCVVFDFTESYWTVRSKTFNTQYKILKNIFCVAASRGKKHIIFVKPGEELLSEETLSTPVEANLKFPNVEISGMFDYKRREDVEAAFDCVSATKIPVADTSPIAVTFTDAMIDLSPCVGIYNEASFFEGYDIDRTIKFALALKKEKNYPYEDFLEKATLEEKILFFVAIETNHKRYYTQANSVYVDGESTKKMHSRLLERVKPDDTVQAVCSMEFANPDGSKAFTANGMCDVLREEGIYELKFVRELQHTHFLQLASYLVASDVEKGYLWNIYNNDIYEVTVPDKKKFLDKVINCVTEGVLQSYTPYLTGSSDTGSLAKLLKLLNKDKE